MLICMTLTFIFPVVGPRLTSMSDDISEYKYKLQSGEVDKRPPHMDLISTK